MIPLNVVLLFMFWHWVADFVLQTDWQAKNKSSNNLALLNHVLVYSMVFYAMIFFLINPFIAAIFFVITFVAHFTTDYFTSRLNTKLWKEGKVHYFFVSIGFDQFLHYAQLFITYYLLTKK
jgi:ABC-type multidrug transport system fused ATPase/permease subunit